MKEQYAPPSEEIKKVKEMMSEKEAKMSKEREETLEVGYKNHEQEKNTEKYGLARKYLEKRINDLKINIVRDKIQGRNEGIESDEQYIDDLNEKIHGLDRGMGGSAVESLERMSLLLNSENKGKNLEEWRRAIFETSNEFFTRNNFMKPEEMAEFFNSEYLNKIDEMDEINNRDRDLNADDKRNWLLDVKKWGDVSNELMYGNYENARVLIENEIRHVSEIIKNYRAVLKEEGKSKSKSKYKDVWYQKNAMERIDKYSEKLGKMRRVRDSLYA
ncbi:hypothetical protein KJ784_03935, partial [Patescibacteria group bacterium]|nr:hypothetical protein [Patescibacteria group bacterium]